MIDSELVKQPPHDYRQRPDGSVPLLLFLHGTGEIGGDRSKQVKTHGPWKRCVTNPDVEAALADIYVMGPHLGRGDWDAAQLLGRLDQFLQRSPKIDRTRIWVTGLSLGGLAALMLGLEVIRRTVEAGDAKKVIVPSAIAAFCPSERHFPADEIELLSRIPTYFFHAVSDTVSSYAHTIRLSAALGGQAQVRPIRDTELRPDAREAAHICWPDVYDHPDLYAWFGNPRLTDLFRSLPA